MGEKLNVKKHLRNWLLSNPRYNPYILSKIGLWRAFTSYFRILPDFIIIGAEKCGTTSLYDYLIKHPSIISSNTKEVHYFDTNYSGLWWYRSHFPTIFQKILLKIFEKKVVTGEATPYYMFHPLVPQRIFQDLPNVKLIVIIRDPVERSYSQYQDNLRKNQEELSFEDAIQNENNRLKGEKEKIIKNPKYNSTAYWAYSYLAKGRYAEQFKKWFSLFPREQFLILYTSKLQTEPQQVLNEVFAFLGISNQKIIVDEKKNVGKYDQMKPETRKILEKYFIPHNEELEKVLGRKNLWEY